MDKQTTNQKTFETIKKNPEELAGRLSDKMMGLTVDFLTEQGIEANVDDLEKIKAVFRCSMEWYIGNRVCKECGQAFENGRCGFCI